MIKLQKKHLISAMCFAFVGLGNSASAAQVAEMPNGATLDVSGFIATRFGFADLSWPFADSEDAPAGFLAATEAGVNTQYMSSDKKLEANIQFRVRSGGGTMVRNVSEIYVAGAHITYRPIDTFRFDVGKIISRSWQERTLHWDNFTTYRPIPGGPAEYAWFPESQNGADFTFTPNMGGDLTLEYGLYFSQDPLTNADDAEQVPEYGWKTGNPYSDDAWRNALPKAQTWIGHLELRHDRWHAIALLGSEELEVSPDEWATAYSSTSTGGNLNLKYWYNKKSDSNIKLNFHLIDYDQFNSYGQCFGSEAPCAGVFGGSAAAEAETQSAVSFQIQQAVSDSSWLYAEVSQTTNFQGIKDFEASWLRLGYKIAVGDGGRLNFDYEHNQWDMASMTDTPDPSTFIGLSFFQGF